MSRSEPVIVDGWTWRHSRDDRWDPTEVDEPAPCYVCGEDTPPWSWWQCIENGEVICDTHDEFPTFDPDYW
jgi:hypothetical protein